MHINDIKNSFPLLAPRAYLMAERLLFSLRFWTYSLFGCPSQADQLLTAPTSEQPVRHVVPNISRVTRTSDQSKCYSEHGNITGVWPLKVMSPVHSGCRRLDHFQAKQIPQLFFLFPLCLCSISLKENISFPHTLSSSTVHTWLSLLHAKFHCLFLKKDMTFFSTGFK